MIPGVAPFVGAWIETASKKDHQNKEEVAPFVGAWIETAQGKNRCYCK